VVAHHGEVCACGRSGVDDDILRPIIAPTMAKAEAMRACGIARRKYAIPDRSRAGPAERVPAPTAVHEIHIERKKPPMMGTKSTPQSIPPSTMTMPIINVVMYGTNTHPHHGSDDNCALQP